MSPRFILNFLMMIFLFYFGLSYRNVLGAPSKYRNSNEPSNEPLNDPFDDLSTVQTPLGQLSLDEICDEYSPEQLRNMLRSSMFNFELKQKRLGFLHRLELNIVCIGFELGYCYNNDPLTAKEEQLIYRMLKASTAAPISQQIVAYACERPIPSPRTKNSKNKNIIPSCQPNNIGRNERSWKRLKELLQREEENPTSTRVLRDILRSGQLTLPLFVLWLKMSQWIVVILPSLCILLDILPVQNRFMRIAVNMMPAVVSNIKYWLATEDGEANERLLIWTCMFCTGVTLLEALRVQSVFSEERVQFLFRRDAYLQRRMVQLQRNPLSVFLAERPY